jgi:uncharacterized protein YbjT (DUF2867 family)
MTKISVVTGASGGVGRAVVRKLAERGGFSSVFAPFIEISACWPRQAGWSPPARPGRYASVRTRRYVG